LLLTNYDSVFLLPGILPTAIPQSVETPANVPLTVYFYFMRPLLMRCTRLDANECYLNNQLPGYRLKSFPLSWNKQWIRK